MDARPLAALGDAGRDADNAGGNGSENSNNDKAMKPATTLVATSHEVVTSTTALATALDGVGRDDDAAGVDGGAGSGAWRH